MDAQKVFEQWFLCIEDVDETLLKKEGDTYKDGFVLAMFTGFSAGWTLQKETRL